MQIRFVIAQFILVVISTACAAQTDRPLKIGTQFTVLHVESLGEGPVSVGARASYNFDVKQFTMAPEVEFNYFPQNPSGNFGETQLLAGMRIGVLNAFCFRCALFLKTRPGLVHFGGGDFKERNHGGSTNFAVDIGGVFEYLISDRVFLRLDWGDTLIHFPDPIATGSIPTVKAAGWYHNFQSGVGVTFRF